MPAKKSIEKKISDKIAAEEIEAKKTVRKTARKVKEAVDPIIAQNDTVLAAEIEVKKTARKTARKVKEAVEPVVKETKRAARRAQLQVVIQSPMGGAITTDEIAERVPAGADAVYVRVDENMLYWVKGDETGAVNIW